MSIDVSSCPCSTLPHTLVSHGLFPTAPTQPRMAISIKLLSFFHAIFKHLCDVTHALVAAVETHVSLGAHIPISVHPSSFALLSTATRTQPARELSDAQLGTPNRVLRRSHMSSYSLPLLASVVITRNSFGSVWTSSRYSAQPPAPNPHESSPMRSVVHPIGSCEGPA